MNFLKKLFSNPVTQTILHAAVGGAMMAGAEAYGAHGVSIKPVLLAAGAGAVKSVWQLYTNPPKSSGALGSPTTEK